MECELCVIRTAKEGAVIATAHNITYLEVPQYGDPRRDAYLACHYVKEQGDPDLHSVKWYRDNNEIFRYTPGQQPSTRTFNTTAGGVTRGICDENKCSINVVLPKRFNTRISFTCEVSTEGPRFAVVNQTKYLTVAVTLKEDPVVSGLPGSVQIGEDVLLNCSTGPAMPPANIMWYIDGRPEKVRCLNVPRPEAIRPVLDMMKKGGAITFRLAQILSGHGCFGPQPAKVLNGSLLTATYDLIQVIGLTHARVDYAWNAVATFCELIEQWMNDHTEVSTADDFGLRSSWRPLRFRVTTVRGAIGLTCEATQPTRPSFTRSTNVTLGVARSPHLSMFTASVGEKGLCLKGKTRSLMQIPGAHKIVDTNRNGL
ncbi:unnamed protein product [Leptosia nina]|uniref:Ig-like domain-containing protein n=1 Tax=Leptosia nina TaxID=320188 RepID=A0AAV1JG61_9NEOP